jgi:hypothetical protein
MSTISPNMNLVVPAVGSTPGPQWASDLNSSLTLIDQHDHTPGNGVQITPSGLNINSDLSFQSNNATLLRTSRYAPQVAALALSSDIGCIYVAGVDLYYNDVSGNQIRITQGGSVSGSAGTITGLPSGTASASYAGGTFTWQSATATPATMDQGSTIIRELVANGKGVTLQTVTSLAANYTIILPQLPASQKIMTLDASGNMTAPYGLDGTTISLVSSNTIGVTALGIGSTQLAAGAVTATKIGAAAVGNSAMAANAIANSNIIDSTITNSKRTTAYATAASNTAVTTGGDYTCSFSSGPTSRLAMIILSSQPGCILTASTNNTLYVYRNGVLFASVTAVVTTGTAFTNFIITDPTAPSTAATYDLRSNTGTITPNNVLTMTVFQL